jgi:hypothetical protein
MGLHYIAVLKTEFSTQHSKLRLAQLFNKSNKKIGVKEITIGGMNA